MGKARYVMVGGFLGAGKTTAILRLAEHLSGRGQRVGLITNDQSVGLVDTAILASHGFAVQEITGGCFCCKFNSLMEAADQLAAEARPEVFIAEPVGSCTDLTASVTYPLRRMYGEDFSVAPLSVLVDPIRALRVLGAESGPTFSKKVLYVYGKQLEEAAAIVINKIDLLSEERRGKLRAALAERYPGAKVFEVSARRGDGLEGWFEWLESAELGTMRPPELDYEEYAEGEALLGWMNCTVRLSGGRAFDGNEVLRGLARSIHQKIVARGAEVAHLKMTLTPEEDGGDIAVLNLVRSEGTPEMSHALREELEAGTLILNARAEVDPAVLAEAALEAIEELEKRCEALRVKVEHMEHFRPSKPNPTYRMAGA
jgi:G3E family GTPase